MTILDTLKSLLGLESNDRPPETSEDVGVTVEREPAEEPDVSSERSVKGVPEAESGPAESAEPAVDTGETPEAEATEASVEIEDAEEAAEEAAAEEAAEPEATEEPEEPGVGTDESPEVLEGIGPAYAERLANAGVETVADLATADADSLAEEADVSETRVERWIERAQER